MQQTLYADSLVRLGLILTLAYLVLTTAIPVTITQLALPATQPPTTDSSTLPLAVAIRWPTIMIQA